MARKLIVVVVVVVVLYAVFHHSEPTRSSLSVADAPVSAPETFAGYDCTGDCSERQGFVTPAQLPSGAINFIFLKLN